MHRIEINKHIPNERWGEFFEMFSHGNKGRLIEIEVLDQEKGVTEALHSAPLSTIDYQPSSEGDSVIVHTGHNGLARTYAIAAPKDVWTGQDENGVVMALDIADEEGNHTIVKIAEMNVI